MRYYCSRMDRGLLPFGGDRYTYARDTPRALYGTECTSVSRISTTTTASRHRTCQLSPHMSSRRATLPHLAHAHTLSSGPPAGPGSGVGSWPERGRRAGEREAHSSTHHPRRSDFVETCSPVMCAHVPTCTGGETIQCGRSGPRFYSFIVAMQYPCAPQVVYRIPTCSDMHVSEPEPAIEIHMYFLF